MCNIVKCKELPSGDTHTHTHTSLLPIHTQEFFSVKPYMSHQPDITAAMRTILVDWLIEVQENFELFHETLYLAVKLADLYLMRREVKREYLQLVGATCMLIAAKFEVLILHMLDQLPCSQDPRLAFVTSYLLGGYI